MFYYSSIVRNKNYLTFFLKNARQQYLAYCVLKCILRTALHWGMYLNNIQYILQALREDMKKIKEAMLKQAEDLCESQYQLNLVLENSKLPANAV